MSNQPVSHTEADQWWGTFFPSPDKVEDRVAGQLTYDLRHGLKLDFFEPYGDGPLADCKVIFGILGGPKKQPVTLNITLDNEQLEFSTTLGGHGVGKSIYVKWAIFGFWLESQSKISEVRFHQSNLAQLIGKDPDSFQQREDNKQFPQGLHAYRHGFVGTSWRPIGKWPSADDFIVYGEVPDATDKLNSLQGAIAKFDGKLLLKTESNLHFAFKRETGVPPSEIELFCNDVLSFLSILTKGKTATEWVSVTSDGNHGSFVASQLASDDIKPIKVLKNAHHRFPVNGANCDSAKLFAELSAFEEISASVSASIRFGGTIEMHLVMLLMALEAINKFDGNPDKEKYEIPVSTYLAPGGRDRLIEIKSQFDPSITIGKFLSDLRANFVHISHNTIDISFDDMIAIRDLLIALVTSFALSKTSLDPSLIEAHQKHFLRPLLSPHGDQS